MIYNKKGPALLGHEPLRSGRRFVCVSAQLAAAGAYFLSSICGWASSPARVIFRLFTGGWLGFRQHLLLRFVPVGFSFLDGIIWY